MTNKARITYAVSLIVSLVLAVAAAALRTYVLLTSFDEGTGNFDPTPFYDAFLILIAVSVLLVIIPLILLRSMNDLRVRHDDVPSIFASAFTTVALVMYAVYSFIQVAQGTHSGMPLVFSIISAVTALASVPYFVCSLSGVKASEGTRSVFATLNVLFGCMLAFFFYTENTLYITSPIKILHIASAMVIAFFFIGESRIALNRVIWNFYACVAFPAFIVTFADAVSCLIYIPVNTSEGIGASAYCFLILAYSIYIFARLLSVYLVNCKNASGLLSVFEASTKRAHAQDEEQSAEQLHIDIEDTEKQDGGQQ